MLRHFLLLGGVDIEGGGVAVTAVRHQTLRLGKGLVEVLRLIHGEHGGQLLMGKLLGDVYGFDLADQDLRRLRHLHTRQLGDGGEDVGDNGAVFFGQIVASALLVAKQIGRWRVQTVAVCLIGAAAAWWITVATPAETPDTWWFILLSGAIAICAMILPGISGAFILLLLGKYQFIMQAVGDLNVPVIVIFVVGAAAGIISFSHLLSWLLKHWHDVTVAVLMGFMVGSLNKVWPWKEVVETYTDSHGKIMPLVERNVAPGRFEALAQQDALLGEAVVLCVVGFLTIYCIELAARIVVKKREE